ncbi:hypothetical protein Tco_0365130 [Tanacetum coccineum]
MATTSNLLTELTPFKDDWHIKVRIIKLWKLPSYKNPMETFRIELILLDEEGNKIQATVKNTCVKNHEKSLGQDMCLYISEFGVTDNDAKDTFVVKHPYKINFYRTTRVKKCDDFSGPVYGFNFKPFTDLLQEKKDSTFAYDLIGDITSCGKIETQEEKGGKLKRFIRIEMQDTMGNKLQNVTLWGAYADQLDEYMGDRSALGHVVLIIQFAKHKIYREKPNVSNMFNATNLFINADIPEINSFKKTLLENLGGEASVNHDVTLPPRKVNLADIRDIAEIKSVVVVATIKVIERDNKWYYLACGSCNRIVDEKTVDKKDSDSGELKKQVVIVCSNKEVVNYKIQIRVLDKSGSVSLTLFDRVASKLLNRTAEEFIREMRKNGDMDHFPEHFNILLGCTYAFKVDITKYCLDNHKFVYPVATFTDDGSIIEELEAMQSTEEQLPSNSEQPLSSFLSPPTMGKLKMPFTKSSSNRHPKVITGGKSIASFDIPRINLNGSEDEAYDSGDDNMFNGTSVEYLDHGDPTVTCGACGVVLWAAEARLKRSFRGFKFVGDIAQSLDERDIVIETKSGDMQHINVLHPSFLSLQYPLLFPYGEDNYRTDILHRDVVDPNTKKHVRLTIMKQQRFFDGIHMQSGPIILITAVTDGSSMAQTPDMLCKLFKIKLDHLVKSLKENQIFGKVQAAVYTIEFQKRGLPHSHICIFIHPDDKILNNERIDDFISAEIPDEEADPQLYKLVSDHMMHGPCGPDNPSCPCTIKGKCTKKFPKTYSERTSTDSDGYPVYKRRDDGKFVEKSGVKLNNRFVVGYNSFLLKKYQAHINVEYCNQAGSIKYLFKYINKGPDRVTAICTDNNQTENVNDEEVVDEIKDYYDCRYLSACEACWRILGNEIHYRFPAVERLPFHLPGQQQVVYEADDDISDAINKPSVASLKFLGWMECNKTNDLAKTLTYVEFPTKFVWKAEEKVWQERKRGYAIGRIHYVPPSIGEAYYLRVLLHKQKGPEDWDKIKEVNDIVHPTYRDACYAMGLLDDDREYIDAIEEANSWACGEYVRKVFARLLTSNTVSRPDHVWNETWRLMCDDIEYEQRELLNYPELELRDTHLKNLCLQSIDSILRTNGSSLDSFPGMPLPDMEFIRNHTNVLIHDELCYNKDELVTEHETLGFFLLYGYGGTGKTYVWRTLSAALRSKGEIVLNVASSGIASLLLSGGRTAHSRFAIPINVNEESFCSDYKPGSDLAALLEKTSLIIWDEAPMMHKHCFESLDRTLRDILGMKNKNAQNIPFGGKVIVFGGDFRQILPVIPGGTRPDVVHAALNSSYLWNDCEVLRLTVNMRLQEGVGCSRDVNEIKEFADWILNIGDGKLGGPNDGEAVIDIPDDLLIKDSHDPVGELVQSVYPSFLDNLNDATYFQERAILAPTHEVVEVINDHLLDLIPGKEKVYYSSDSICESEGLDDNFNESLYSPDVLNGLKLSGIPNHRLALKVGAPVMLLRNIDQSAGLCNGTRLRITKLGERCIEAEIITGTKVGEKVILTRMKLSPSDKRIPFKINRRQFPISVCFAMTINKSQGQSLSNVGIFC